MFRLATAYKFAAVHEHFFMKTSTTSPSDAFRDTLGVLDKDGHRLRMYPKAVDGQFYKARTLVGFTLLALLFVMPWVHINGQQFLLFNVLERKAVIFGVMFFPQDLFLFALAMITFVVFVIVFSIAYGRLFCGWVCPQTVFMEMVFRRIEHWIEGDANQQRKLDNAEWTTEKIMKKTAKHTLFLLVSFLIANTFLAYLVGSKELLKLVTHSPFEHLTLFLSLLVFTGAFYIVFAKVRELVCIVACPYGRLQSVLLDNKSMVIAYDFVRGEPRGKLKKNTAATAETPRQGDCIDCKLCVQVCPTGIDIRNGTQLECINCTACIDACDDVMEKINKPKKLIRYDSIEGITNNKPFGFTKRLASYSVVLVLLVTLLSYFLLTRKPLDVVVMRTQGQLYQEIDSVTVSNLYNVEFVNKTPETIKVWLRVKDVPAKINWVNSQSFIQINSGEVLKTTLFIETAKKTFNKTSNKIILEVMNGDKVLTEAQTTFLAPMGGK